MPTTYAIPNGRTVMGATTYTGNGSTNNINNSDLGTTGFKPDLVWTKDRGAANNHMLGDSVRGANNTLFSNLTVAAYTDRGVDSFNSNGFTYSGTEGGDGNVNGNSYVAWQWQAGQGTTSSNTQGSITSTVSVNTTAGFSIVTWTGNGGNNVTIGHGLGVAPKFIIVKNRGDSSNGWGVWHNSLPTKAAYLNDTGNFQIDNFAAYGFNEPASSSTFPTSTVFYVSASGRTYNSPISNGNGQAIVAYCWAEIAGFSAFGSYTGNGSTDGPFIYTGFRPRWIMIKRTDAAYSWWINDSARDPRNVVGQDLAANLSNAESSDAPVQDFLSNGFKLRTSAYPGFNANGGTYIYAAFAENPLKFANAR